MVQSKVLLSGTPSGGSITVDVGGFLAVVPTSAAQTLEEVADAVAVALHGLSAGGVSVQATKGTLVFEGLALDAFSSADSGLSAVVEPALASPPAVPLLWPGAVTVLISALMLVGGALLSRRSARC